MKMAKSPSDILKERDTYLQHLGEDINKYDKTIQTLTKEQETIDSLITNLQTLKTYPEQEALIPLGKNIYMKGRIVHTGEYFVKRIAHPDSIVMLQTADDTIKRLEEEKKTKEEDIDKAEYAKFQIEERIKILNGEDSFQADKSDMPKQIKSEKGVAVRVGDFYEILEFEE
uniref:Uncharacterized protein LOC114337725 n=1 Tax=Diabrotica virgifera virgifera TaxID=50390 RepID=A0A6P7GG95_DIAVI